MFRSIVLLACALFLAMAHPVVASPRTDADFIANKFVQSDGFRKLLIEMIVKARVSRAEQVLSEHSVKILDFGRLEELLSDFDLPEEVVAGHERLVADRLQERMEPEQLASFARHLRFSDPYSRMPTAEEAGEVLTFDEFERKMAGLADLPDDPDFRHEMEELAVGTMLITLAVQASRTGNPGPTSAELAELLEVDGVFGFPNRIARRNLIRDLRAATP